MFKNRKSLTGIISAIVVLVIAIGLTIGYRAYVNHNTEEGMKNITVKVIAQTDDVDYEKTYTIKTDEKFLGYVLIENITIEYQGDEGSRYITGVDSIVADSSKEEWWKILINGEMGTGMDEQSIKDGDVITLELNVGYF